MNTTRRLACLGLATGSLLACSLTGSALADPYDFHFSTGPDTIVLPVDDFQQFHSVLTNVGDEADSYTLYVTMDQPANWIFSVCYGSICYPPAGSYTVPATGMLAPGATVNFDFDVTSFMEPGAATYTLEFVSNSDGTVAGSWTLHAFTPSEPHGVAFARGDGVLGTTVDNYVQFHSVLYNAGTQDDSFTLTIERQVPENWVVSFCYGGVCYPGDAVTGQIPAGGGTIPSAGAVPIDIDFTTLTDEGVGTVYVTVTSNADPSLSVTRSYTVTTAGSVVAVGDLPAPALSGVMASPNPFNPATSIRFDVAGDGQRDATVEIYDMLGRRVRSLRAPDLAAGAHAVTWDGRDDGGAAQAAGVYLARVRVGDAQQSVKMSLVK